MTAQEYKQIMDQIQNEINLIAVPLLKKYKEAEQRAQSCPDRQAKSNYLNKQWNIIFSEEYKKKFREIWDKYFQKYGMDNMIDGKKQFIAYDDKRRKEQRKNKIWRRGTPIEKLKTEERKKAIDRLRAIPSEIEVMLFLHDQGKVLFHAGQKYSEWMNIKNGVDIEFSDAITPPFPGLTDLAFIDVKNVRLNDEGKNFPNLLIEVSKNGNPKFAWGGHYIDGSTNRYIAYVRDGKDFGGKIEDTGVYSEKKTEKENAVSLIRYFMKHKEKLTHDIYFVRGDDIGQAIRDQEKKYNEAKGNAQNGLYFIYEGKKCFTVLLSHWRGKYPLLEVSRTADGWTTNNTGKGKFSIYAEGIKINAHEGRTAEQIEEYVNDYISRLKQHQKDLTVSEVLKIYGLLHNRARWKYRNDY